MDPLTTFLEEAETLFEQLERTLLELDTDPQREGGVDEAFRALHTLKGSGSMMGFAALASFAHVLEAAFDRVRSREIEMSRELAELALQSVDILKGYLQSEPSEETTPSPKEVSLREALSAVSGPQSVALPEAPSRETGLHHLAVDLSVESSGLKEGADPLVVLRQLATLGETRVQAKAPQLELSEDFDEGICHLRWSVELSGPLTAAELEVALGDLAPAIRLDVKPTGAIFNGGPASPANPDSAPPTPKRPPRRSTVKVDIEKLDTLLDLVGELVIARSRLAQLAESTREPGLRSVSEDVERLTQELRDQSMSLRMQPVGLLFGRYTRLVRDLSRQLGREIELTTEGDDTEVDKTVLERLGDSMVHLIRNAVDHGIEMPDAREASGKPRQGNVRLSARHGEGCVIIEIRDDGKGLDRERILAKALRNGLLSDEERDYSDEEIFPLIFEPGFSTTDKVSDVSGRGVGMDVVRRSINDLGGHIEISSALGKGTTFAIRIPLTLAIVDGLLVHLGEDPYVLPLDAVEECIKAPRRAEGSSKHRVTEVRGELVSYLSLREWFGIAGPSSAKEQVVITNYNGRRFGFVVDDVVGQHQTVVKQMGPLTKVRGLSGSTILGDGQVALILDGAAIMRQAEFPPTA